MLFYEKLYKLRKEKGLSQEALAEKLGTTRQAVSKWETGQGFPETEKLLLISNTFEVSIDYLLRDTQEQAAAAEKGYYVSREMTEGFLSNQRLILRRFCFGSALLICSLLAFFKYRSEASTPVVLIVVILLGGFCALRGLVSADDKYKVLQQEALIFDPKYLAELKASDARLCRTFTPIFLLCMVVMLVCIMVLSANHDLLASNFAGGIPMYIAVTVIALAIAAPTLFYTGVLLESYALLAKSEDRVHSYWFRARKKAKKLTDDLLK